MISGRAKQIRQIFNTELTRNTEIEGIILLSYEGLLMESEMKKKYSHDVISAMMSGIHYLATRFLKDHLHWKPYSSILIAGSDSDILLKDVNGIGLLVVLIETAPSIDRFHINSNVNRIVAMLKDLNNV